MLVGVAGFSPGVDDDHGFGDEKNQPREEHSYADHRGPGEAEIVDPVDDDEYEPSKEEN